jgi:hypothetical protein
MHHVHVALGEHPKFVCEGTDSRRDTALSVMIPALAVLVEAYATADCICCTGIG